MFHECEYQLPLHAYLHTAYLTLRISLSFSQGCLLLIFNVTVSILYLVKRETVSLDAMGERIRAPVDLCLSSFITIIFYTPVFLQMLFRSEGYIAQECESADADECDSLDKIAMTSIWLMFFKSWLVPLAWFSCRDTRKHVSDAISDSCC